MNERIAQLTRIALDMYDMLHNLRDDLTYDDPRELTDRLLEISTCAESARDIGRWLVMAAIERRAQARMERDIAQRETARMEAQE